MKHFSKYLYSRPNIHEKTKLQHWIQNIENKPRCTLQKAKPYYTKYETRKIKFGGWYLAI